jgi:hypothetical protein
MKIITRANYPVSNLPDDLREGLQGVATVTVTVTLEEPRPEHILSLEEIFAMRRPPFRTKKQIDAEIRRQRDEWSN